MLDIPSSSIAKSDQEVLVIEEVRETWMTPMWKFLTSGTLPEDPLAARCLKKLAPLYSIFDNHLYKRGYVRPWLKCVTEDPAKNILLDIHEGLCGSHQGAKTVAKRAIRAGFYWPTMQEDAANLVKKCVKCQYHSKLTSIPPYDQISISRDWPFDLWGIDIVEPFPKVTLGRKRLIVTVEYFTKWVEAEALSEITAVAGKNFIWHNIICRFGVPHAIISDNGMQFNATLTKDFLASLGVYNNFASVSHSASNGLAEVTNRMILDGLKKKVAANRKN